jgi:hypothetical protein
VIRAESGCGVGGNHGKFLVFRWKRQRWFTVRWFDFDFSEGWLWFSGGLILILIHRLVDYSVVNYNVYAIILYLEVFDVFGFRSLSWWESAGCLFDEMPERGGYEVLTKIKNDYFNKIDRNLDN